MALDLRSYACVTAAYWAFTLTDGALRMLVLLHFHQLGYSPLDLAVLFLLYEVMGIVTNLVGGWLAARYGLRLTLYAGLALQIVALAMLSAVRPDWSMAGSVAYVMAAQALSGIAKDLTKMSSKSAVKLVAGEGTLFKWVAILTGSKNALKGLGFFVGGVLLESLGFVVALWALAAALAVVLAASAGYLRGDLGQARSQARMAELFSKDRAVNILSAARLFLFGARDVWFVVALPLFLTSALGWGFAEVGGFLAAWVIGYGFIQAAAPALLRGTRNADSGARAARLFGFALAAVPAVMALALGRGGDSDAAVVIGGLAVFGALFAINSSVHSYLILAYSESDKVAMTVGFYYMSNAAGRLLGQLLSGLVFQGTGLGGCLWTSAAMVAAAAALALLLPRGIKAATPASPL